MKKSVLLSAAIIFIAATGCVPSGGGGGGGGAVSGLQVGGTVTGLSSGDTVELQLNGSEIINVVDTASSFTFPTKLSTGNAYKVLVSNITTGNGTVCMASSNTGTMASSSITNVKIDCSSTVHTLSVNVSAMESGNTIVVENNGDSADQLSLSANGTTAFLKSVPAGAGYSVVVATQPSGFFAQTCTASANTGVMSGNTTVNVVCGPTYHTISGNYTGLAGAGLKIKLNNSGEEIIKNSGDGASGSFTFTQKIAEGVDYTVVRSQNPSGLNQTCTVTNGTGTMGAANVTNVSVDCVTNPYTVGGSVTGLSSGDSVVLRVNGGSDKTVSYGTGTYSWNLTDGTSYNVSVATHAPGKTCSVANATGNVAGANISNVNINCVFNTYTVGGAVTGLCANQSVTLKNNGGSTMVITGANTFTFPAQNDLSAFNVTASSAPAGITCTPTLNTGNLAGSNVTNVSVSCTGCMSCAGDKTITVTWGASRSSLVDNTAGGGHKIYYQTTAGVSKTSAGMLDVPYTTSKTTGVLTGRTAGCTYYVKVHGYSAINTAGGNLSSEMSVTP
jgi:large repetitive protein